MRQISTKDQMTLKITTIDHRSTFNEINKTHTAIFIHTDLFIVFEQELFIAFTGKPIIPDFFSQHFETY